MRKPVLHPQSLKKTLDPEVISLCEAIDDLPGIKTYESCCGHGERPFRIWVWVDNINDILPLLWVLDPCHAGHIGKWICRIYTDCVAESVRYMIEGPIGERGYTDANLIANAIRSRNWEDQD